MNSTLQKGTTRALCKWQVILCLISSIQSPPQPLFGLSRNTSPPLIHLFITQSLNSLYMVQVSKACKLNSIRHCSHAQFVNWQSFKVKLTKKFIPLILWKAKIKIWLLPDTSIIVNICLLKYIAHSIFKNIIQTTPSKKAFIRNHP